MNDVDIIKYLSELKIDTYISKTDHCLHDAIKVEVKLYYKNTLISKSESTACL